MVPETDRTATKLLWFLLSLVVGITLTVVGSWAANVNREIDHFKGVEVTNAERLARIEAKLDTLLANKK